MLDPRALFLLAVAATVAAGCSSCSRSKPMPAPLRAKSMEVPLLPYRVVPSTVAFTRVEAPSSECPHGSSARSGRASAAPRSYAGLTVEGSIADGPRPGDAPRFIDVPPRGDALVLERPDGAGGTYDVRSAKGALVFGGGMRNAHVLAHDDALYVSGRAMSWTGTIDSVNYGADVNGAGELLACAVHGDEVRTISVNNGLPKNEAPSDPDHVTAKLERPHDANAIARMGWTYSANEPGVGAIDAGGHAVIALSSGRLVVLSPEGDPKTAYGVIVLDTAIDKGATDLSIVPPFALVLYGGGDGGRLIQRGSAATRSQLDARGPDGALAWRVTVPFLATQPPLDGNQRVYVVGAGIAAVDMEGRMLWSVPSPTPLRAAAFGDGTLAVVRGNEVQIVGTDGAIRQSFRAAEDLTTYPAIGADGTIWAASAKTLYRLH